MRFLRPTHPLLYEEAFARIQSALEQGELVCIFPEGQITQDGQMSPFRPGILRVLDAKPVPVVPIALQGLWGSLFSRKGGQAFFKLPRRMFARIGLVVGEPIPAESVTLDALQRQVSQLRGSRL